MSSKYHDECLRQEREAKERLLPFLRTHADGGMVIDIAARNPLGLHIQKQWGTDYFLQYRGQPVTFESKSDRNYTGRIPIECWSNFVTDYSTYLKYAHSPGWLLKSQAMILGYHWYLEDKLAIVDMFKLQQWAFAPSHGGAPNIERWQMYERGEVRPEFPCYMPQQSQVNKTWLRWVPLAVLARELKPPPLLLSVQQLHLDLGDRAHAFLPEEAAE
jgi:hypothetical protein